MSGLLTCCTGKKRHQLGNKQSVNKWEDNKKDANNISHTSPAELEKSVPKKPSNPPIDMPCAVIKFWKKYADQSKAQMRMVVWHCTTPSVPMPVMCGDGQPIFQSTTLGRTTLNSLTMAKETTPKSSWPKRGIHGSNRDKSQDEVSNKCIAARRSKKTVGSKDESQKEASRKRALALMDSESLQQEAQPLKKVPQWTLCFQCDAPDEDLESSNHKVDVDELEQEDEGDELEDNNSNMPQSDEHGNIDQEESRDKVCKDDNDDDDNNDKYIKDNPDSANKQPADLDDEIVVNFHADNKGKQQSKVTELDDKHVTTVEAFPFPVDKDELCWKLIQESAVKEPGLEQVLAEIWGAATQVRGELITKARLAVPTACGLQGESLKGNALFDVLKWLIQQGKLIHSGIDAKPWKNPIFLQLIKMQWWGPKQEGRYLGLDPVTNPYLNAPATMLALIASVVECVLTSLFSGGTIDFNENVYHGRDNYGIYGTATIPH
ncbi:hypothetical protein EDC04DRAFT_2597752 [Pisolithus marmoratus]|nr:hypothetical protein EDC04DRAFT_2597752 [Pisolithus marmoratus]